MPRHQLTFDDYETETDPDVRTDGGLPAYETRDDGKPIAVDEWDGRYLWTSWGYDQTTVNVAQITEVSESGRTVKARLVTLDRDATHPTSEAVSPTGDLYGDEFRLYVREGHNDDTIVFRGRYPYVDGDTATGTRLDTFLPWAGRDSVRQTAPNAGH